MNPRNNEIKSETTTPIKPKKIKRIKDKRIFVNPDNSVEKNK